MEGTNTKSGLPKCSLHTVLVSESATADFALVAAVLTAVPKEPNKIFGITVPNAPTRGCNLIVVRVTDGKNQSKDT
jgi:hypothetical protein